MFVAGFISVMLFVGGGIATPYNTYAAIGLYVSSPIPILIYRVTRSHSQPEQEAEPPKEPPPTEDPVAPTLDEPSAV